MILLINYAKDDTTVTEQASESPLIGSCTNLVSPQSPKLKRQSMLFQPIPKKTSKILHSIIVVIKYSFRH